MYSSALYTTDKVSATVPVHQNDSITTPINTIKSMCRTLEVAAHDDEGTGGHVDVIAPLSQREFDQVCRKFPNMSFTAIPHEDLRDNTL